MKARPVSADGQEAMLLEYFRACDRQGRNALVYLTDTWRGLDAKSRVRVFELADRLLAEARETSRARRRA
jgi:hypothetical protein